jgi:simple sugar transport system permease protein
MVTHSSTASAGLDERLVKIGFLRRIFRLPEVGAVVGALVIAGYFAYNNEVFRSVPGLGRILSTPPLLGIMAVAVAMLMIGGEFDLSAGTMTGSVGLLIGMLAVNAELDLWLSIFIALLFALTVGFINGFLVIKTGLPSFIITLATFFILRGANTGITQRVTQQVRVAGIGNEPGYKRASDIFNTEFTLPDYCQRLFGKGFSESIFGTDSAFYTTEFRSTIIWWVVITLLATWILLRTKFGSWIFAVGGDANAARSVGVPVTRVKISLFMMTSAAAWLVGTMIALQARSITSSQGVGEEFKYIIAAVIGGCLLTGGYGSAIGASIGALIFGMTEVGIRFSGWNNDWFFTFLGAMLLISVLLNNFTRRQAERISTAATKLGKASTVGGAE